MTVSGIQMLTARFSQTHAGTVTFLKNPYTGFHENSTNGWVADTRSRADAQTWSTHMTLFVLTHSRPTTHKTGFNWLYIRIVAGFCKHGNEHEWKVDNVLTLWMIICFVSRMLQCKGKHGCMNLTVSSRYCTCITEHKLDKTGICPPKEFVNIKLFGIWYTVTTEVQWEVHLSRLTGTASHPDMQKFWIIFFENSLHWQFEVPLLLFTVCTCI